MPFWVGKKLKEKNMKNVINYKELVGQTVCVYEPYVNGGDVEKTVEVFSVTSVGSKYITAGSIKFDKDLLVNHDCGTRQLFIGTAVELLETLSRRKSVRALLDAVSRRIDSLDADELYFLEDTLANLVKTSGYEAE